MRKGQWLLVGAMLIILSVASILSIPRISSAQYQKMMSKHFKEVMGAYMDAAASSLLTCENKSDLLKKSISMHAELHSYFIERGMRESTFIIVVEKQDFQGVAHFFNGANNYATFKLITETNSYPPVLVAPIGMRNITVSSEQELDQITLRIYAGENDFCFRTSAPSGFSSAAIAVVEDEEGNVMIIRTSNLETC